MSKIPPLILKNPYSGHIYYESQAKQSVFHNVVEYRHLTGVNKILYGGAAKGGKSHALRFEAHNQCLKYDKPIRGLLIRGSMPDLKRTHISRLKFDFPPGKVFNYNQTDHFVNYHNQSVLEFGFGSTLKDIERYLSTEYAFIMVDELTTIPFELVILLMSRLAAPFDGYVPFFAGATNPGSTSHNEVKSYFIDKDFKQEFPDLAEQYNPDTIAFIPARIYDNPLLLERDPEILNRLRSLSPNDVKRFLEGDWDIFEGQFFEKFSRDIHEINFEQNNIVIPSHWPQLIGLDHGNTTVAYKVAMNPKTGIHYVIWEWKEEKLEDSELANSFWNHLVNHGDTQTPVYYDTSMSAQNVNLKAANIPSAVNIFRKKGIIMRPVVKSGNPDKNMKFRESCNSRIKDLLNWQKDKNGLWLKKPKIYFNAGRNPYLMKSLPKLQYNPANDRDIFQAPNVDDHGYDAVKYAVISHSLPRDVQANYAAMQQAQKEQYSR